MADATIEHRKVDFPVTRYPLVGIDVADVAAVREWLLKMTELRIRHEGTLKPRFRYLTGDKEEALDVGEPEPGDEPFHTIFFHQFGGRPEVRRRFREGELRVEVGDAHRRAAVLLEHVPIGDVDHWWLAWRLMGEREGKVGVFHSEWVVAEGVGTETIPEPFREWLHRVGEVTHAELTETPTQIPPSDVLFGTAPLPAPVPQDPVKVAEIVGQLTDAEIARTGIQGLQVLAFRGLVAEQFIIRGKLGCPVDDVIRNIALQGDIDAIALLFPGVVKLDGVDTRALVTIAEVKDGRRGQRVVPLKWRQDGSIEAPRAWMREMPDPEPAQRWIGVKPETEIEMYPMALDGGQTPEG